jgi:hypothetical protein
MEAKQGAGSTIVSDEPRAQPLAVELIAVLVAVADGQPLTMTIDEGRALPSGPFEVGHLKDNHIAIAGGVAEAIRRVRAHVGHLVKIEVEVDTLAQQEQALGVGVDAVLLDNMSLDHLQRGVAMIDGRAVSEASGRVNLETAPAIAETGFDLISVGWLTHSAPILDIGLDYDQR